MDAILTIPNALTLLRILLTPLFIMAFVNEWFSLAWMLFAVAAVSDGLDGFLARTLNQRSHLGAILDPIADKLLLGSSFVTLAIKGWLPASLAVLVVSRDVLIIGGVVLLRYLGLELHGHIRPTVPSKLNTLGQIFLVLLVLLQRTFDWHFGTVQALLVAAVAGLTLASGAQYLAQGLLLLEQRRHAE